jgi:hypothetical protein
MSCRDCGGFGCAPVPEAPQRTFKFKLEIESSGSERESSGVFEKIAELLISALASQEPQSCKPPPTEPWEDTEPVPPVWFNPNIAHRIDAQRAVDEVDWLELTKCFVETFEYAKKSLSITKPEQLKSFVEDFLTAYRVWSFQSEAFEALGYLYAVGGVSKALTAAGLQDEDLWLFKLALIEENVGSYWSMPPET